ncbi:MAG: hypothetical protein HY923_01165 [Elusimicrobia bacterium]|nr:hypothetical protein [Elusimicrobiota bacterium]
MNRTPRVLLSLLLAGLSFPAFAQNVSVPRVTLTPSLGGGLAVPGAMPGAPGITPGLSLSPMLSLTPSLAVLPSPALAVPSAFAVAVAPTAAIPDAAKPVTPAEKVAPALEALNLSAASKRDRDDRGNGREFFDGGRQRAAAPVAASERGQGPKSFTKNADGVYVAGRVAEQSRWIENMVAELSPVIDVADVTDVMDDAYDEGRVKLVAAEKAATSRQLEASSVHLEGTRNWLDAILTDADGSAIAVHTHRVYFHPGRGNEDSEIGEGIRRASKYLDQAKQDFAAGGLAETEYQTRFKQVELTFVTQGYKQIEDALRVKADKISAETGGRFIFNFVTEPKLESSVLRAEYNRMVEKFRDQPDGLMGILDGVTYSRTVGVGHELNSHKIRLGMGLKITQAGRDFFGPKVMPDGRIIEEYKTEFDAVTVGRDGEVTLWEDKSTRVWMPIMKTMEETFLYKLRIYRENRALIEKSLGAPLKVIFSVDVGGSDRRAAKKGILVWKDPRQGELLEYLKTAGPALSKEFGFPVSFIFVNSHPGENPDLYNQEPMDADEWARMQKHQGGGRKHGRR